MVERDKALRKELAVKRAEKLIGQAATEAEGDEEVGVGAGVDAGEDWKVQLLRCLMEMPPDAFERLAQRVLREAGFVNGSAG